MKPPSHPFAVIDWNFLQTLPKGKDVPPQYGCLLQDANLHELFAKESSEREKLAPKFGKWISRNVDRIWFAHHWQRLSLLQSDPVNPRRIRLADLFNKSFTCDLRARGRYDGTNWTKLLKNDGRGKSLLEYQEDRSKFISLGDSFRNWINEQPATRRKELRIQPDQFRQWIQDPQLVVDFVMSKYGPKRFSDRRWRNALEGFPDRLVIARWSRIVGYYAMLRAAGANRKFENNWDDAHYGLFASFTGHLATCDAGLIKMAGLVFPGVKIVRAENC